jgi:hypothetical protein
MDLTFSKDLLGDDLMDDLIDDVAERSRVGKKKDSRPSKLSQFAVRTHNYDPAIIYGAAETKSRGMARSH